jgi:hypothetical protein
MELWFRNADGAGNSCERWDSRFGENYLFPVEQEAPQPVQWAGRWGAGLDRSGVRQEGVEDPLVLDDYRMERTQPFVEADVYAPGVTDQGRSEWMEAKVVWGLETGAEHEQWLEYRGREGNDMRYRWELPLEKLRHVEGKSVWYRFEFSTDGRHWLGAARKDGSDRRIELVFRRGE